MGAGTVQQLFAGSANCYQTKADLARYGQRHDATFYVASSAYSISAGGQFHLNLEASVDRLFSPLGAIRIKLTNMLSIFADSLGQQASRFEPVEGHGCSPKANLIFPACLGKCLVSNKSSLYTSCEEFKHSKSFVARARLLQIQIGADCLCRSRALAPKAVQFRLVRLRSP